MSRSPDIITDASNALKQINDRGIKVMQDGMTKTSMKRM